MRYRFYTFLWAALDWIFPPNCGGCDRLGVRWCSDCQGQATKIEPPHCEKCGQPIQSGNLCHPCQNKTPNFSALRSWAVFDGPVRNGLHRLKYRGNLAMGEALSMPMIDLIKELHWDLELVVPVPLGATRQKERGYNQAALLARPVALYLNIPFSPQALARIRETQSQVELNRAERIKNVAGAFRGNPNLVAGKNVLVIDDVTTSGSTIDSCAEALLASGANQAYGLTLARAKHNFSA